MKNHSLKQTQLNTNGGKNKMAEKVMPLAKAKAGSMGVSLFKNQYGYSVVVQKSYKQKDGTWKNSSINMFESELADLEKAIADFKADCSTKNITLKARAVREE